MEAFGNALGDPLGMPSGGLGETWGGLGDALGGLGDALGGLGNALGEPLGRTLGKPWNRPGLQSSGNQETLENPWENLGKTLEIELKLKLSREA